jgi:hypothetical protein
MPVRVRKRHKSEGGKLWKIVEVETGRVVGSSDSREKAEASAIIRNVDRLGEMFGFGYRKKRERKK